MSESEPKGVLTHEDLLAPAPTVENPLLAAAEATTTMEDECRSSPPPPPAPPPLFGSCRFTLVALSYVAVFHIMILRFNISMGLVCMVKSNDSNYDNHTLHGGNVPEFDWDKNVQTGLLSAFFYGYICTQILGGWMSDRFGSKIGLQVGVGLLAVGSVLTPVSARFDHRLVFVLRVVQGLVSGLAFPSVYNMFNHWSSPSERATLMSIVYAGIPTASLANFPLASVLCETGVDGGWPMVFYVPGLTGLLWLIAFTVLAHPHPFSHPRISASEREFLAFHSCHSHEAGERPPKAVVPWSNMARSRACQALVLTHLSSSWCFYLIVVNLPLFSSEVMSFDVVTNGLLAAVPHAGMFALSSTGVLFDRLRASGRFRLLTLRRIFNTIGFLGPALANSTLHLFPPDRRYGPVLSLSAGLAVHQLVMTGGFYLSHRDVAGKHSGVLFGITNTFAQIPGFLNPMLIAWLTPNKTRDEWYAVFLVSGVIAIFGCLVYALFGSVELEEWANGAKEKYGDASKAVASEQDNSKDCRQMARQ